MNPVYCRGISSAIRNTRVLYIVQYRFIGNSDGVPSLVYRLELLECSDHHGEPIPLAEGLIVCPPYRRGAGESGLRGHVRGDQQGRMLDGGSY